MTWWQFTLLIIPAYFAINILRKILFPPNIRRYDNDWEELINIVDSLRVLGSSGTRLYVIDRESGRFLKFYKTVPQKGKPFLTFAFPVAEWSIDIVDSVKAYLENNDLKVTVEAPNKKESAMGADKFIVAICGSGWKLPERIVRDVFRIMNYDHINNIVDTLICGRISLILRRARGW